MKGFLAMLAASVMLSGCVTKSQQVLDDYNARKHDEAVLRASGVGYPDIQEYEQSKFAKTHDMKGFLMSKKAQQKKEIDANRAPFDQDAPALLKQTKACVMRNYTLSEQELPVVAKQCFPEGYNYGRTPYAWRNEVINRAVADLSPHYTTVREQLRKEARQQAIEDRAQAAQDKRDRDAEAKRAYDNSLKSLVE